MNEQNIKLSKKSKINLWKILAYFAIYSFLGYIIEMIFAILTKGVLESRQSFLYGPFCGIYGIGAVVIIIVSKYIKNKNSTIFLVGFIIGSVTEYLLNFFLEIIMQIKWWDYTNYILNINGRICLLYSIFWGILSIFLIKIFNPFIEKLLKKIAKKISTKYIKTIILVISVFLLLDSIATCIAQNIFVTKIAVENNIEVRNIETRKIEYNYIFGNITIANIVNTIWSDKKMIKTFPNMKIADKNNNIIYLDSLKKEITPYYFKFFEK